MSTITQEITLTGSISATGGLRGQLTTGGAIAVDAPVSVLAGSISREIALNGSVSAAQTLSGQLTSTSVLNAEISLPKVVGDVAVEVYDGDYVVTPEFAPKVLHTTHKYMQDDVTIHAIPYYEVTNPEGGTTVYIGMEVDIDG